MSDFDKQFKQAIESKILKEIKTTTLLQGGIPWGDRKSIPGEALEQIWKSVDWDEVIEAVRPEIQKRICNSIIGAMETETKTDVKKLLGVDGVRQKLRMEVYPKLMQVLEDD